MGLLGGAALLRELPADADFDRPQRLRALLRDWCEALLRLQIDAPSNPSEHGAFRCPACGFLHGRCADAVYPLLAMSGYTGSAKYHRAAIRVVEWSRNVDAPDGAWNNELDPHSWKGTTVFGAIALANALDRYGSLLDAGIRDRWGTRLRAAGKFIRDTFVFGYGNINYPVTATHALFLLGKVLREPAWQTRARELARESRQYYTQPNQLLYGEGAPLEKVSPSGCRAVDLGYNVEESLPSLLRYARLAGDEELGKLVRASMRAHLEFLLPDGGWDNSWGTRSFKWTYWGSRTSDGALSAYLGASDSDPAFGIAADRQLALYERCTRDGLLHGGPHLAARGIPPCVHHTFVHAKCIADALDCGVPARGRTVPLPRESADGVRAFPEIGTWVAARGAWRATVTRYDWLYQPNVWHPTGGAMSLLYHLKTGPILCGSQAEYRRVETANMQAPPDPEDYPLTPRVEISVDGRRFSTLYDLGSSVQASDESGAIRYRVDASLRSATGAEAGRVHMEYRIAGDSVSISAEGPNGIRMALPLIAEFSETVRRTDSRTLTLRKSGGIVNLEATAPIDLRGDGRPRVFNLVPGFLAIPVTLPLTAGLPATCTLRIS